MRFHIVTLFPDSVEAYLSASILGRGQKEKHFSVEYYNPIDFANNKRKDIDEKPYGGGPGMVMRAEPILKAVKKIKGRSKTKKWKIIFFTPNGKVFNQSYAKKVLKNYTDVILICGRYEGIDARVKKALVAEEVSLGDFVLTGGEIPAMIVVDVIARQIDGVLGKFESVEENRVSSHEVYTRPEVVEFEGKKYKVPKVLLSGDHKKIDKWREGK